jgi:hypothetical protein
MGAKILYPWLPTVRKADFDPRASGPATAGPPLHPPSCAQTMCTQVNVVMRIIVRISFLATFM